MWSPDGRLLVEAVSISGRAVAVEVRLTPDLVWVSRVDSPLPSLFDRTQMRRWLFDALAGYPMTELAVDEARWDVADGRVTLSLDAGGLGQAAIEAWELSPADLQALWERI